MLNARMLGKYLWMFSIFIDDTIKNSKEKWKVVKVGLTKMTPVTIQELTLLDNMVLLADLEERLG